MWLRAFTWVLCLAALLAVLFALSWWAAVLLALLTRLATGPGFKRLAAPRGTLVSDGQGGWMLYDKGIGIHLDLLHVWDGPGWSTLRFAAPNTGTDKRGALMLTVWRGSVPPACWRRLRQYLSLSTHPQRITEGQ